jgi:hypothetical protein
MTVKEASEKFGIPEKEKMMVFHLYLEIKGLWL